MWRSWLIVLIIVLHWRFFLGTCVPDVSDKLVFSPVMPKSSPVHFGSRRELECCMYGMQNIVWTFKSAKDPFYIKKISSTDGAYRLSQDGRYLTIIYPRTDEDTGRYICEGSNAEGQSLVGETYLDVEKENSKESFKFVNWSDTSMLTFKPRSTHTLFCLIIAEQSEPVHFRWWKDMNNRLMSIIGCDFLNDNIMKCGLVEGYDGSSEIEKFDIPKSLFCLYNFTLTLNSLNISHQGSYWCEISDGPDIISHRFEISLRSNLDLPISLLSGLLCGFFLSVLLIYIFKYDIKLIVKASLKIIIFRNCQLKKYHFFFLYNFDDDDEFKIILKVVHHLGSQGFSSYFHHRDQTYGKDTLENFSSSLRDSCMVVIWTTVSIFDSPKSISCMHTLITNFSDTKRVYVITSSRKQILINSKSRAVSSDISSCLTSKSFQLNPAKALVNSSDNILIKWHCHRFLSWLISSLPLKSESSYLKMM